MLKIGQNWGKIANYLPKAQQRSAPLVTGVLAESKLGYVILSLCLKEKPFVLVRQK